MKDSPIFPPFDENDSGYSNGLESLDSDSGSRSLAWLIIGVGAIGCGLFFAAALFFFRADVQSVYNQYFPSPTVTVSPTPNMTATQRVVQITGTAQAIESIVAEAGSGWDVLIGDSFDNVGSSWITGTDDDEYATIVRRGVARTYQWDATSKQGFISWITANDEPLTDFYLSVEAERVDGSTSSDYGLVFRKDTDGNFYYFGVGDEGFFISVNYEDEWIDVVDFTYSSAVHAGESNRITVLGRGSYFILMINDTIVAEIVDDKIPAGTTALAIQMHESGAQATIEFDNLILRVPVTESSSTIASTSTPTEPVVFVTPPTGVSVFTDWFDSNQNNWDPFYEVNTVRIAEGKLILSSNNKGISGIAFCQNCPTFDQAFYYQAELRTTGLTRETHGLLFCMHSSQDDFYAFQIDQINRSYAVYKITKQGWTTMLYHPSSDRINYFPKSNTVGVLYDQGRMTLYINGAEVNSYTIAEPLSCGRIGLIIENGGGSLIADSIIAYELPYTASQTPPP